MPPRARHAQVWVELKADDPEAVSAHAVARTRLPAAVALVRLSRWRLIELSGALPPRGEVEGLIERSIQFYNPHKERVTVRMRAEDPAPVGTDDRVVLVWETDGERRPAAERWWRHEHGTTIEVREGTAWGLAFAPGAEADACAAELAAVRDMRHGLLCNARSQSFTIVRGAPALPGMPRGRTRAAKRSA